MSRTSPRRGGEREPALVGPGARDDVAPGWCRRAASRGPPRWLPSTTSTQPASTGRRRARSKSGAPGRGRAPRSCRRPGATGAPCPPRRALREERRAVERDRVADDARARRARRRGFSSQARKSGIALELLDLAVCVARAHPAAAELEVLVAPGLGVVLEEEALVDDAPEHDVVGAGAERRERPRRSPRGRAAPSRARQCATSASMVASSKQSIGGTSAHVVRVGAAPLARELVDARRAPRSRACGPTASTASSSCCDGRRARRGWSRRPAATPPTRTRARRSTSPRDRRPRAAARRARTCARVQ